MHVHRVEVRFGDCDPAGIVYFPRFYDYFHQAMETWFAEGLGLPYVDVIRGRKIGFPAVHSEADFHAPSTFGDALAVEVRVPRVGRSSIELAYRVRAADDADAEPRVTGKTVCVVMDLDPQSDTHLRALAVPDDLRARIEAFRAGG